jgi:hypothetical protein
MHKFKELIEDNGLQDLLYDSKKKPKHDRAAAIALFWALRIVTAPQTKSISAEKQSGGRGPVDFKLSRGAADKVVVEVKLLQRQLKHGL